MSRLEVDVVVVGGGPSGLAAASWLGRYRRSVVVLDSRDYRSKAVERSHGYLGRDPQRPLDLRRARAQEVLAYPTAEIRHREATTAARREDGLFEVDDDLLAHRLVLACGVKDAFPEVEGFDEHYGASVFHCPSCDGYEARDRDVVALGWDPHLVGFAETLLNWASSVTVVTNGVRFRGDEALPGRARRARHPAARARRRPLPRERGDLTGSSSTAARCCPRRWCCSPSRTSRAPSCRSRWAASSTTRATSPSTTRA